MHRIVRTVALAAPLVLAAAACGDDGGSSGAKAAEIEVTITDDGCQPASLSAASGPTTFMVSSESGGAVTEYEILSGTKILGEVENVTKGITRKFSLTLKAGSYVVYCPGAKREKGTLEVADSGTGQTGDPVAKKAAVESYVTYVKGEADKLITDVTAFTTAVKANDLTQAKTLFAIARSHYETIEPIAESFGDLDPAIDARDGDVPAVEWTGFHKIEKSLWVDNTTSGLATVADKLLADVKALRAKIDTVELEPATIANGAVELLNEVSASKITGEEDRYSHTDLYDFDANLAGSKAAYTAVKTLLAASDAELTKNLDQRFSDVESVLAKYKSSSGYVSYEKLTDADKTALSQSVDALAEPLSRVAALVL